MAIGIETTEALEYVDRVGAIADVVRAGARQADVDGHLADATVDALRETGLLRMLLPAHYGGGGLHITDTLPVVEALSRVNGSAGWNLQIGATTLALAHDLADEEARDEVLGDARSIVAGTINFMSIKVTRADGGCVFDGEATFLSGAAHADWLAVGGWLHEDGQPQFTAGGMPEIVRGVVPMSTIELRDTWDVSGMRATASNDATLDAMFIPDRFLCTPDGTGLVPGDPAAALPLFSRFGGGLSWVSIGIARGALDALRAVGATKVPLGSAGPLIERTEVQIEAAKARGLIEAGAAFLRIDVGRVDGQGRGRRESRRRRSGDAAPLVRHRRRVRRARNRPDRAGLRFVGAVRARGHRALLARRERGHEAHRGLAALLRPRRPNRPRPPAAPGPDLAGRGGGGSG